MNNKSNSLASNDVFRMKKFFKIILQNKRVVLLYTFLSICFGLVLGLVIETEFTSVMKFIPKSNNQNAVSSKFQGLASLAGVNINDFSESNQNTLNPSLYQHIVYSLPYLNRISRMEFTFEEGGFSLYDYFGSEYDYKILNGLFIDEDFVEKTNLEQIESIDLNAVYVTKREHYIFENIKKIISLKIIEIDGYIEISVTIPDRYASAHIAKTCFVVLDEFISNYDLSNLREQLDYCDKQILLFKKNYDLVKGKLGRFDDSNVNINSKRAELERRELESVYELNFNLYSQLLQKRESIRLEYEGSKKALTIIDPPSVPLTKSSIGIMSLVFLFGVFGFIVGSIHVLIFKYLL